jgi:RecB family endonuclease NucS
MVRLLIVKADGSVLVHSDGGSTRKPLNWMSPPRRLAEGGALGRPERARR